MLKLTKNEYVEIYKKLEFRFKSSGNLLVQKIKNNEELSDDELNVIYRKFECNYKKGNSPVLASIREYLGQ